MLDVERRFKVGALHERAARPVNEVHTAQGDVVADQARRALEIKN